MDIYYKLFIGFFVFLGLVFIWVVCRRSINEGFAEKTETVDFQLRSGNDFQDNRFQIYNQNSNEPWKELPVESNNPIVQYYGTTYNDMYKMNQYIFNDFEKKDVDKFVKKYSDSVKFDKENYLDDCQKKLFSNRYFSYLLSFF